MMNYDVTERNRNKYNPNHPQILNHLYRILISGFSGSEKSNALLDLINHQLDINKIYLYAKNPCEAKDPLLINKIQILSLKHNYPKALLFC